MLTNERADLPAITQRRALAQETRPAATPNRPQIQPRCETPPWFDGLMAAIGDELGRAHDLDYRYDNRRHPARAAAHKEVEAAQERVWSTNTQLRQSKGLKRRRARHQAAEATDELAAARERQQIVAAATLPDTELFRHADLEVRELRVHVEGLGRERSAALGADDTSLGCPRAGTWVTRRQSQRSEIVGQVSRAVTSNSLADMWVWPGLLRTR